MPGCKNNNRICHSNIDSYYQRPLSDKIIVHFQSEFCPKKVANLHQDALKVKFECDSPSDPEVTESILGTSSGDQRAVLDLDDNHRVVIYQHSLNRKLYLCSLGWDDNDAKVLCKSLNKTLIGNAKFVEKLSEIPTHPYSMHCDGHESSLLACNFTEDENGCNKTTVAGAVCSQGTGIPAEGVTNPSSNKLSSVKSGFPTLEVALGVPLGIICMICISVAVVLIRRRSVQRNLVIENAEDRTRTGKTSRIQETGLYECTNVTDRSSDHTYDPLNLKN
ncbi:unnamed protein product [Mytilus edulis]|uniref:SRCR domain-containing protein n=1 Tax=Mytilus edulis TaxID=6550 RepID=A0A8S3SL07_MYTED|nr:unnamed protein product [Mytilus edulis]